MGRGTLVLVGVQLAISSGGMRVLSELSQREGLVAADMNGCETDWAGASKRGAGRGMAGQVDGMCAAGGRLGDAL